MPPDPTDSQKRSTAFLRPHRGNLANLVALAMKDQATPQPAFEFYASPPDPAGHAWRAFTLDTTEEDAAAAFLRRYGRNPDFVFESRGLLLVGPVPTGTLEAVPSEV